MIGEVRVVQALAGSSSLHPSSTLFSISTCCPLSHSRDLKRSALLKLTAYNVERRSAWSRAKRYQIGGIPEPAAIDYLVKHHFTKDDAQRVVRELTGDRLYLLREVRHMSKLKFEGMNLWRWLGERVKGATHRYSCC